MSFELNAKFFRKAKRSNRAVEITDNEAVIPAVKDSPEIRVPLPNRRLRTIEERKAEIDQRYEAIRTLEEEIESERKNLLALVQSYRESGSGASEVVVKNLKIKELMDRRKSLAYPTVWIEELAGLNFKDIFQSKRDERKIGADVYQVKRRVEPISSLYVDLGVAASEAAAEAEEKEAAAIQAAKEAEVAKAVSATATAKVPSATAAAQGAIIGQRRVIKLKKTAPPS
jgi:hypothetical protein